MIEHKITMMGLFYKILLLISLASTLWAVEDDVRNHSQNIQLNMMWLNATLKDDQRGLFPNDKEHMFVDHIVAAVSENKDIFPINLWYSSKVTSPEQRAFTQGKLQEKGIGENAIVYKDIRDMPYVQEHPEAFDHAVHPPYFLSDLARVAVLLDDTTESRIKIYQDLNFPTHNVSSMMHDVSYYGLGKRLETNGFALAHNKGLDMNFAYENSFIALDTENKAAKHALDFAVLQMNTLRAEHFAENNFWNTWNEKEKYNKTQIVFSSFKLMFPYYHYLVGNYGIGDDQAKMPQTFEGRVALYNNPLSLFDRMNPVASKVTYKQGRDEEYKNYVGYQHAGKTRNGLTVDQNGYVLETRRSIFHMPLSSGGLYTLAIGKEQSSFYNKPL